MCTRREVFSFSVHEWDKQFAVIGGCEYFKWSNKFGFQVFHNALVDISVRTVGSFGMIPNEP